MILLTGATGTVGSALLRRLTTGGRRVRCLVRDPRRLGAERVRVQIALGDLADPSSFRHALRGVETVLHLAASVRDQPKASIEELNAVATLRLAQAAERAGTGRFIFFSALGASPHHPLRFFRSKALAEQAVQGSGLATVTFAPSILYAPGDPWLTVLERLSYLPVMPVSGRGDALYQPMWADDAADAVVAVLGDQEVGARHRRLELAGPETLSHDQIVTLVQRALGRRRPHVHVPLPMVRTALVLLGRVIANGAIPTWQEAELLEASMIASGGTADSEALGVRPHAMRDVLGAG